MTKVRRYKKPAFKRLSKNKAVRMLEKEAEALWKELCHLRDGDGCQVEKHFPQYATQHTDVYQIDHCISRGVKALFFSTENGTKVCSGCNASKSWNKNGVGRMIDEIVIEREGHEKFDEMKHIERSHIPFPGWKKVYWLEEVVTNLHGKIDEIKANL